MKANDGKARTVSEVLKGLRQEGLPFEPLPQFRKAEMEARQQLYRQLADRVWDPQQLLREAQGGA